MEVVQRYDSGIARYDDENTSSLVRLAIVNIAASWRAGGSRITSLSVLADVRSRPFKLTRRMLFFRFRELLTTSAAPVFIRGSPRFVGSKSQHAAIVTLPIVARNS
jgi:hypothetical protein